MYKIRRKSDGLFSRGGIDPPFSKRGKIYPTLGILKNHLAWVKEYIEKGVNNAQSAYFNDTEIVEYVEVEANATPTSAYLKKEI
jgi:hypothetical protein